MESIYLNQPFYRLKFIVLLLLAPVLLFAQRPTFTLIHDHIETYDHAEIVLHLPSATSSNPCMDVLMTGTFISQTNDTTHVEGRCDSPDGNTYRLRFMPTKAGMYRFTIKSFAIRRRQIKNVLTTGMAQTGSYSGVLTATAGNRIRPAGHTDAVHASAGNR